MSSSKLFTPLTLGDLTFRNRLWIAAMCQYSALRRDGVPTDWHLAHLGQLAAGGTGLVITEATAVNPDGRISPEDVGIWNDEQVAAWSRITALVASQGAVPGMQLSHAGRKASTFAPWGFPGRRGTVPVSEGGWVTVAPSAIPYEPKHHSTPVALSVDEIDAIVADFRAGAERAARAGFRLLELHGAHGYLIHQFLSPASNHRTDEYGGSLANRARLLLRLIDEIKEVAPELVLFVRFSATDWVPGGWDEADTATVARWAADAGADFFDISTGGNLHADIPVAPGYQVPFAQYVRQAAGVPVGAVGLITDAEHAEHIVASGQADAVFIAREALRDPHTPIRWARELGAPDEEFWAPQYLRARTA